MNYKNYRLIKKIYVYNIKIINNNIINKIKIINKNKFYKMILFKIAKITLIK